MSINTELTALADAIRAKSGTEGKLSISGMTTAVNNIVIDAGDDIDLSGVTVTADKMLSGIVAVGATGEKVTGNIPTVTASSDGEKVTVPVGYIASEQTFDIGGDGYDTSAVTVTADTMLAGKIAIGKNGETITGNIATVTPSLSGRTFTVAKGYVAENFESSVPEATVTETESKVTISTGYVSEELSYDLGGGGIDTTTSVPPAAADVRLGKEFWANGEKYTGTMPDSVVTVETFDGGEYTNKLTISAGFLENDFELDYNTSAVVSLPFVTATAADIREGMVGADNSGNPVYGTLVVGGDTPASGFSVAKVTEYTPYSPAFNGITEIEVSNIGYVGNQVEDWGQDYSEANGKYIVTEDTYYETDEKKRIYKHETKNYWIKFYDDTENEWYGSSYWVITSYESDNDPYSAVVCVEESNFTVGVSEWYSMEYDMPVDVGIATTITDKPEQPQVLKGKLAGGYDEAEMDWLFSETLTDFTGFDVTPKVGEMYNTLDGRLIGGSLGYDPGDMESNAVMYSNPGNGTGTGVNGRIVPYIHKSVVDGVPCVWMDIDTAGIDSTEHLRSRENYAYIPLSKSLSISCPEYYPNPPPPFNQLSLVGTMFCKTWGNTSSGFFLLSKELIDQTGATTPVDTPRGVELGIAFDPNYGFKVQGAPGYSSDYKKYYEAYNGKWMQFVLIYDNAQFKLYLNNELRVIAHDVGWAGMPWTDSLNYLFFRQPYYGFTGEVVYFGKMYAFDRVLSEAEIARAYRMMTAMELPTFTGIPSGYKFRASFNTTVAAETGQAPTITGDPEITERQGVPCAYFDGSDSVTFAGDVTSERPVDDWNVWFGTTESVWVWLDPEQYDADVVPLYDMRQVFGSIFAGKALSYQVEDYNDNDAFKVAKSGWNHVAIVRAVYAPGVSSGEEEEPEIPNSYHKLYINGSEFEHITVYGAWPDKITVSTIIAPADENDRRFVGCVAEAIAYDRILSEAEIKQLAAQFKEEMKKVDDESYE